jgi:cytosine/adenosine deaminase-related metal-dependent hydrolase
VILGADWVIPVDAEPVPDGRVEIADGRIVSVSQGGPADEFFADSVILPGLVNAHTHLEYSRMSGFGDGKPFGPWIEEHIRRKAALDHPAESLVQAREGARISLEGGVTTVADCCYAGTVAEAAIEAGLRAIVYLEGFSLWDDLRRRMTDGLDQLPTTDLVTGGLSPHAPFTVSLEDYAMMIALARERGLPIATHLLESARETQHLDEFADVLGPDTVLIHGVFMNAADIEIAARLDVPVIHCPRSNALLGCGTAPIPELLAAGIRVGLGTDSPASAMVFDMWEEMRTAVMLTRAHAGRADALTAEQVLRMATLGGAEAIGLGAKVGSLTPGKAADVTVLDLSGSPFVPWDDPVTAAVFGGTSDRIVFTSVSGKIRYRREAQLPITDEGSAVRAKMIKA